MLCLFRQLRFWPRYHTLMCSLTAGNACSDFGSTVTAQFNAPLVSVRGEHQKHLCTTSQTAPAAFERCEHHLEDSTIFRFPPDLTASAVAEYAKPNRLENTMLSRPTHVAQKGSEPVIHQEVPSASHVPTQLGPGIIPLSHIRAEAGKIAHKLDKSGLGTSCTPLQPVSRSIRLAAPQTQVMSTLAHYRGLEVRSLS